MKHILFTILIILLIASCKNKSEQEQQVMSNIKQNHTTNYVVGVGKIIPENDIIQLSSPVNGIVQKIYKKENDTVRIGSIILEMEHLLEDGKIRLLNNELNTQAAQIKVDQEGVAEFEAKLSNAKSELIRLENLLSKGAETQQIVDDATTNLKTLNANLKKLEASVIVSKSKWQEIKAAYNTAQLERDQKIIKSPINGRILELTVLIGGAVSIPQSLAQIRPEGKTIAICEIDESNADKIVVGQKAWIRSVGSSDTLSTGNIYFTYAFLKKKSLFTDQSGEKEDRRVRTIKMLLDQPEHLLLNARVECVIDISSTINK